MDEETEANLPLTSFYIIKNNPAVAWNHILQKEKIILSPILALQIIN